MRKVEVNFSIGPADITWERVSLRARIRAALASLAKGQWRTARKKMKIKHLIHIEGAQLVIVSPPTGRDRHTITPPTHTDTQG